MGSAAGKEERPQGQKVGHHKAPVFVTVQTADVKAAGTDNDVLIRFIDVDGKESESHKLDNILLNNFKKGETEEFVLPVGEGLGEIVCIEIWREGFLDDKLFLNVIFVKRAKKDKAAVFPVNRWIPKEHHLKIWRYDSFLPQNDPDPAERQEELQRRREVYDLTEAQPGLPVGCSTLPDAQSFTTDYQWDLGVKTVDLFKSSAIGVIKRLDWSTLADMKKLYTSKELPLPQAAAEDWYLRDDYFAEQRLSGCNPVMIKLCTAIPSNFAVTSDLVAPFLEGNTLAEALEKKKLFLTDYVVLKELKTTKKDLKVAAPLGLFYLTDAEQLLPVAIQLEQEPGDDNPVFLPSDPPYTWTLAKLWFNNADSSVHQAKAHLGFTHLIAESVCVVTHRQLSPSHPVFRLLAPHFLYLMAINHSGLPLLLSAGGLLDRAMNMGRVGASEIIRRTLTTWRLNVDGTLPEDVKERDVGPDVLPHYPYRDDGIPVYNIIKGYVTVVIVGHYSSVEVITGDAEIQAWAEELVRPVAQGGAGLKGVPGGGKLTNTEDLIDLLTATIFTCSAQHAAVNFTQYEQYGYPPVYPGQLKGIVPTSKVALTEADIVDALPSHFKTAEIMLLTSILSTRDTNSLGHFEVQFGYDEIALKALTKLREDLKKEEEAFLARNKQRQYSYTVLDPTRIPNAISI